MPKWSKILIAVVLVTLVGGTFFYFSGPKKEATKSKVEQKAPEFKPFDTTSTKVVAEYDGGKITEGELNAFINFTAFLKGPDFTSILSDKSRLNSIKISFAKQLAGFKYISTKMGDMPGYLKKADATIKQIEPQLLQLQAMNQKPNTKANAPKNLAEMIKDKGFTLENFRNFVALNHQYNSYFEPKLKSLQYDKIKLQHILIGTKEGKVKDADAKKKAEDIKAKLDAGQDFTKLAKQNSDDPGSKEQGGIIEVPVEQLDQFVPEFRDAVKKLAINKISAPVKTVFGYHIIKVLQKGKESISKAPQLKAMKQQEMFQELITKQLKFKTSIPEPTTPTPPAQPKK